MLFEQERPRSGTCSKPPKKWPSESGVWAFTTTAEPACCQPYEEVPAVCGEPCVKITSGAVRCAATWRAALCLAGVSSCPSPAHITTAECATCPETPSSCTTAGRALTPCTPSTLPPGPPPPNPLAPPTHTPQCKGFRVSGQG